MELELAGSTFFYNWEVSLMVWLQAHMGTAGVWAASIFSLLGEELVIVGILCFFYYCYDKDFGKYVARNVAVGCIINPMLKNLVLRRRPYMDHDEIKCLRPLDIDASIFDISKQGYSFPSGHSTNGVAVYSSFVRYRKTRFFEVLAIVAPLLIGCSRVCLGMHYPTDVLVGWLLGVFTIFAVPYLQQKTPNLAVFYGILIVLTLPGFLYCKTTDYYSGVGLLVGMALADLFETKYVNFENTRSPLFCVLRMAGGLVIFVGLNTLLKLPFSKDFLESSTIAAFSVRSLRYAIIIFIDLGLYPMLFKYEKKFK